MITIKNLDGEVIYIHDGANLTRADLRYANLTHANLDGANLHGANLTGADLTGANLTRANLTGANLRDAYLHGAVLYGANLYGADLTGADLTGANLTGANLTGAVGLASVPTVLELDRKLLSVIESEVGILDMSTWHTCETTHCRAGWAIHLAGQEGKDLETKYGPGVAGALIYHASTGRVPNFLDSYEDALADIRREAAKE